MAGFNIPSIKDLATRARNSFKSEMKGIDAWIFPNNVYVTAKVLAGLVWQLFGRLAYLDKQRFVSTATGQDLERYGNVYKIGRKSATYASGTLVVQADYPMSVPVNTVFTRPDGATFKSTSDVTLLVGQNTLLIPVTATVAGKAGNTVAATAMTCNLVFTYGGSVQTAVVDSNGIGQGTDQEEYEDLRDRILARIRNPPMGGAEHDYIAWAREVPGVTRAFVEPNIYGRGTVGVYFLMDRTYTNGVPQPVDVMAVQSYLDTVHPVTATVFALAPTPDCVDIEVTGLATDNANVRRAAALELQAVFLKQGGVSTSKAPLAIHRSWLWQAVSIASGEKYHQITAPTTDITFGVGVLPCVNKVTFKEATST
jgi:uncharacterized phage protein gp47/JayE